MHAKLLHITLFLLGFVLPSLALGKVALRSPRWLPAPRIARFLAGAVAAPMLLPVVALASATVPASPRILWVALPGVLGALVLALTPGPLLAPLTREARRIWRGAGVPPAAMLVTWVAALACLASVLATLINNAAYPIVGQDALRYAVNALDFARTRELADLPSWSAPLGGNVVAGSHAIGYQLILALALLATPEPALGFPHDHGLRMVAQIFVVYVLLGTAGIAALSRRPGVVALALIALLLATSLGFTSYAHSRDPYRIAALLLAVLTLLAGRRRAGGRHLALIAVASALAVLSHTVDAIYLVCMVPALAVLRARSSIADALSRAVAAGTGAALAGLHYVASALETGSVRGATIYQGYRDTPLWDALLGQARWVRVAEMGAVERVAFAANGQGMVISAAGAVCAIAFLVGWVRRPVALGLGASVGAVLLVAYVPLLGVFDGDGPLPLSGFFTTNPRYLTHAQPFAAVLIALAIGLAVEGVGRQARFVLPATAIALALAAAPVVRATWSKVNPTSLTFIRVAEEVDRASAGTGIALIDQDFRRYYVARRTAYLGARPVWPLLAAETPAEAGRWLARSEVSHVVLRIERIRGWWARLPLLAYLEGADGVERSIGPLGSVVYTLPARQAPP